MLAPADRSSTSPTDTPQAFAVRSLSATGTTRTTFAWSAESRRVRVVVAAPGGPPVIQRTRSSAASSTRATSSAGGDVERRPRGPRDGEGVALRGGDRSAEQRLHARPHRLPHRGVDPREGRARSRGRGARRPRGPARGGGEPQAEVTLGGGRGAHGVTERPVVGARLDARDGDEEHGGHDGEHGEQHGGRPLGGQAVA